LASWAAGGAQEGLRAAGLNVVAGLNGTLLYEPHTVQIDMKQWRGHFGTLTPFTSACQHAERIAPLGEPLPATVPQAAAAEAVAACAGVSLDALGLRCMPLDAKGDPIEWAEGITNGWRFGEQAALELLEALLARTPEHYEGNRHLVRTHSSIEAEGSYVRVKEGVSDTMVQCVLSLMARSAIARRAQADGSGVSRLSPYLHLGVLSARRMHRALLSVDCMKRSKTLGRRLAWRDLAYWQLHHWPSMPHTPIRPHYAAQPWAPQWQALLPAWQQGKTVSASSYGSEGKGFSQMNEGPYVRGCRGLWKSPTSYSTRLSLGTPSLQSPPAGGETGLYR